MCSRGSRKQCSLRTSARSKQSDCSCPGFCARLLSCLDIAKRMQFPASQLECSLLSKTQTRGETGLDCRWQASRPQEHPFASRNTATTCTRLHPPGPCKPAATAKVAQSYCSLPHGQGLLSSFDQQAAAITVEQSSSEPTKAWAPFRRQQKGGRKVATHIAACLKEGKPALSRLSAGTLAPKMLYMHHSQITRGLETLQPAPSSMARVSKTSFI